MRNIDEHHTRRLNRRIVWSAFALVSTFMAAAASATPSQEDVFKSISNSVDNSVDGRKVLAVIAFIVAIAIVAALFNKRDVRQTAPKVLNHQGKLLRELKKTAGLNGEQIKHLKALADDLGTRGEPLESTVTLMLCPSLMNRARKAA